MTGFLGHFRFAKKNQGPFRFPPQKIFLDLGFLDLVLWISTRDPLVSKHPDFRASEGREGRSQLGPMGRHLESHLPT